MNFNKTITRYENELLESVVPFWEKNCIDRKYGGYFTFLDRDGSVYDTEKFMWMQWRIVYMFATLYMTEYRKDKWLDIARQGYDFLVKHGKSEDGSYYFALNRKGRPSVAPYKSFPTVLPPWVPPRCTRRPGRRNTGPKQIQRCAHTSQGCPIRKDDGKSRCPANKKDFPCKLYDSFRILELL